VAEVGQAGAGNKADIAGADHCHMHIADFQNLFRSRQNVRNVAARTISVIPETPLRAMARH
jgi:hypothetical protein